MSRLGDLGMAREIAAPAKPTGARLPTPEEYAAEVVESVDVETLLGNTDGTVAEWLRARDAAILARLDAIERRGRYAKDDDGRDMFTALRAELGAS